MKPIAGKEGIDFSFPHNWQAEILPTRPLILPQRCFVYPLQVEEVERGALEVLIQPAGQSQFLATCALGFASPQVPTGVWTSPDPSLICIAAGGYVYLIDTREPARWRQVEHRPVTAIYPVPSHGLLLFASFHAIEAWRGEEKAWQTDRLSWDGVRITRVEGNTLLGTGWDMLTDRELDFAVDLHTGKHQGGGYLR